MQRVPGTPQEVREHFGSVAEEVERLRSGLLHLILEVRQLSAPARSTLLPYLNTAQLGLDCAARELEQRSFKVVRS